MTVEDAIDWVDQNKGMIVKKACEYNKYAPYGIDDYMQDAYSAAVVAATRCQRDPKLTFRNVFFVLFLRSVAKNTPFPIEQQEQRLRKRLEEQNVDPEDINERVKKLHQHQPSFRSCSLPNTARVDAELSKIPQKKRRTIDVEKVYTQHVRPNLSGREAEVMDLILGVTIDGSLTPDEIATKLGISRRSVRTFETRAIEKAKLITLPKRTKAPSEEEEAPPYLPLTAT